MRDLFLAFVFVYLTIVGFTAPFVLALCYVWVDILKPQALGYGWIEDIPLSFITGILTLLAYLLVDRGFHRE